MGRPASGSNIVNFIYLFNTIFWMGPSSSTGQTKQSQTYQLMVKCAELALVPLIELIEEETMIGSSHWEDLPGK